jgi:uncharacterized repeat protein (TIGR04052 family)
MGSTAAKITPTDFRFFISEVEFLDNTGKATTLQLEQDKTWQQDNVALLDFENGSGPCRNGNTATNRRVAGQLPAGNYSAVRFTLGVPFAKNHADATLSAAPLNTTAMFWNWQGGYKFLKFDAQTNANANAMQKPMPMPMPMHNASATSSMAKPSAVMNSGFALHIGSTMCAAASKTSPPSQCMNSNRVQVELKDFDWKKNKVVLDVAKVLKATNLEVNTTGTSPGCMSFPKDPDCVSVMNLLGLKYDGVAAQSAQLLFSKQ